jgi:signal transduction histidine kinase/HAMP domain-containing protein
MAKLRLLPELTLGRWFLLWMLLVTVLVLGLSVGVVTVRQRAVLEQRLLARGRTVARTVALSTADPAAMAVAVTAVPELVVARVVEGDGSLQWSYGPTPDEARAFDLSLLEIRERLTPPGAGAGAGVQVLLLLSPAQIRAQVLGTGARLAATLFLALAATLMLGVLLVNRVVEPLRDLADHVRSFHPDTPPDVGLPAGGAREVSQLAVAFADMGQRLARQRRSLKASERRFRELFEASPTPLLVVDGELVIRGANPAALPFLAEGWDAHSQSKVTECLVAEHSRDGLDLPADEGGEVVVEASWPLPDAEPAEVELHLRRVEGEEGPLYLMAIHDLTDRVRRLGERWRRTVDEMADGVAVVDANGVITLANRAIQPHLERLRDEVSRAAAGGDRHEWQVESEGRVLRCVLTTREGTDRILVARDVTDWMRAEEHLREAHKMEAVATLAGGVAHDFNNLLAGILLHVRLLERDPESRQETAEAIRVLAEEGAEVVRGLLQFARPEATPRQGLDVAALAAEQEPLLRHLLPPDIHLSLELAAEPVPVLASPGDLRRLFLNLVLNARNALADGGGDVVVAVRVDGEQAVLEVRDSGPGIPSEIRDRIFEPFFSLARGGRGAGIGLAVVYTIVSEHEGSIEVDDAPGGGARFTVRLPLGRDLELEPTASAATPPSAAAGGERILLVDDEDGIRQRLAEELRLAEYQVREAADLAAAREEVVEFEPQALVVDLLLPDGRGHQLVEELRSRLGQVPAVIITGHLQSGEGDELDLPGAAVLAKPFAVEELLRHLRRLLDEGQ